MGILKWTLVVFAAGFVGYFGKYLSKLLIERFRRGKAQGISVLQPAETKTSQYDYKSEKKRLKVEKKKAKKTGDSYVLLLPSLTDRVREKVTSAHDRVEDL